ncbi:MoxR-like ATPase [Geomicrobium sp. JCM 19037]|uniref:AAA family ATPase n=1 Tax=Geomicrobium sp. JCM 19037 TaxID=1460634 RepID=UPI00045F1B34|nr:MoxR family ATPase [Geomicrobium sp. JCM 19037]GAK03574.1 MoxR-like ATPase [Geomicrobium sp. JCM 19037]
MNQPRTQLQEIIEAVEHVVVGKREVITLTLTALLARGHVLIEDVPGVGKTMLVRSVAKATSADFKRIQFTPDLLPSDVTGVSIYNQRTQEFEFRPGPIMGNIVLADEINRSSPKTQSALLEALEEGMVTVDGQTHQLPEPFFVMATQNPIEHGGTYPLPEAQLDRFLFRIQMGYPNQMEELDMLDRTENTHPFSHLQSVISVDEIEQLQQEVTGVYVDDSVKQYIVAIVRETRDLEGVELGVSPRGSIALMRASQAYAYVNGREYVLPDDVKYLSPFVLGHRLVLQTDVLGVQGEDTA